MHKSNSIFEAARIVLDEAKVDLTIIVKDEDGIADNDITKIKALHKKNPSAMIHLKGASDFIADLSGQEGMLKQQKGDIYTTKQVVAWLKSINEEAVDLEGGVLASEVAPGPFRSPELARGTFFRLPSHVVKNELYVLSKAFDSFYKGLDKGNDLDMKALNAIITKLMALKKEAKSFGPDDRVPLMYGGEAAK